MCVQVNSIYSQETFQKTVVKTTEVFEGGSLAQGTAVSGYYDIDLVLFSESKNMIIILSVHATHYYHTPCTSIIVQVLHITLKVLCVTAGLDHKLLHCTNYTGVSYTDAIKNNGYPKVLEKIDKYLAEELDPSLSYRFKRKTRVSLQFKIKLEDTEGIIKVDLLLSPCWKDAEELFSTLLTIESPTERQL